MKICGIYAIKNLKNNKMYVGQSCDIKARFRTHRVRYKDTNSHGNQLLYSDMRKQGLQDFLFIVLEEVEREKLDEKEIYWINLLNTIKPYGYNISEGGSCTSFSLTIREVEGIIELLRTTNLYEKEIGKRFNVSENIVCGINTGYYWHRNIDYPIRKKQSPKANIYCSICGKEIKNKKENDICYFCAIKLNMISQIHNKNRVNIEHFISKENLLQDVSILTFEDIKRKYDITIRTLRKILKHYNLPIQRKELMLYILASKNNQTVKEYLEEKERIKTKNKQISLPVRVYQIDKNTNQILKEFASFAEAARYFGKPKLSINIARVCKGKRETANGFKWRKVNLAE